MWYSVVHILLQNQYIAMYTMVSVSVSLEANIIGYWILGALFGYRSNPKQQLSAECGILSRAIEFACFCGIKVSVLWPCQWLWRTLFTLLLLRFFGKYPAMDVCPLLPECHDSKLFSTDPRSFRTAEQMRP